MIKKQQAARVVGALSNEEMTQLATVVAGAEGRLALRLQGSGERVTPVDAVRHLPHGWLGAD